MPKNKAMEMIKKRQDEYLENRFDAFNEAVDEKLANAVVDLSEQVVQLSDEVVELKKQVQKPGQYIDKQRQEFKKATNSEISRLQKASKGYIQPVKTIKRLRWTNIGLLLIVAGLLYMMYRQNAFQVELLYYMAQEMGLSPIDPWFRF